MNLFTKLFGKKLSSDSTSIQENSTPALADSPNLDGPALDEEPDISATSASLFEAIKQHDVVLAKSLLDRGADVHAEQSPVMGFTPLHCVVHGIMKDMGIAELLIAHGADINRTARLPELTPLHLAAMCGETDMIRFLLKKGADVNAHNICGLTPLMNAVQGGYYEATKVLLENGANPNMAAVGVGGLGALAQTPLDEAYKIKNDPIIELLEKHGGKRGA